MSAQAKDWLILTCRSQDTLKLPQRLAWAGIRAYAPAKTLVERKGKSRSRRNKRVPVAGGWVFVAAEHLHEMIAIHEAPVSPYPKFSFPRTAGNLSFCPDAALKYFRLAEMLGQAPEEVRKWAAGDMVRYSGSGFEGLVGEVERTKGKSVWVRFPKHRWPVEVSALLLLADDEQRARAA